MKDSAFNHRYNFGEKGMTKLTFNSFIITLSIALLVFTGCFGTESETEIPEESSKKSAEEKAEDTRDEAKGDYEKELEDDEDCESDDCQAAKEALENAEEELAKAKGEDPEEDKSSVESVDESSKDSEEESSEAKESSSEVESGESTTEEESVADESSATEDESVSEEKPSAEDESVADESSAAEEVSSESPILGGVPLELPASKTESWDYLMMGDVKLLLNKWGSDALELEGACTSEYEIWANEDEVFGWTFNRPDCGGGDGFPDYPEIEVGVAPFNEEEDADLRKSTSIILPMQIKDIHSASVTLDDFKIDLTADASWNINFELWLSQEDPTTTITPKPEYELMTFWGWMENRWPCNQADGEFGANLTLPKGSGTMDYTLCHYGKDWGGNEISKWDYFQFRAGDGGDHNSKREFTGKLDVKEALDWLVKHAGASTDLWVTRFEVGTEIGNNTAGTVSFKSVIFEVNGEERSPEFAN